MMDTILTTGSTMVLSVDHHDESMVETSFTCAVALGPVMTQSASMIAIRSGVFEVLLKFFILMCVGDAIAHPDPRAASDLRLKRTLLVSPHQRLHNHIQVRLPWRVTPWNHQDY